MENLMQTGPWKECGLSDPTGGDVFAQVQKLRELEVRPEERRESVRMVRVTGLTIGADVTWGTGVQPRLLEVITFDVSRGGLSLCCDHPLRRGTEIRIRFNQLANRSIVDGQVRYCDHLWAAYHRVGIKFLDAASSTSM